MTRVDRSDDPRLDPFRSMKDRDLRRETGLCLAEGEHLVRRAFEAGLVVRSVLVVEQKAERVREMIVRAGVDGVEVLTCTKTVMEEAIGFELHQGVIAAVRPPGNRADLDAMDEV
ncbi:MAG: RNA methyltransferase substrate-binding domain-containing protein, partial [Phycisphaeraceae bacterium]